MKKGWKIVGILVLVVIILGAICVGAGLMTGAEFDRIYDVLDGRYGLTMLYKKSADYFTQVKDAFAAAGL